MKEIQTGFFQDNFARIAILSFFMLLLFASQGFNNPKNFNGIKLNQKPAYDHTSPISGPHADGEDAVSGRINIDPCMNGTDFYDLALRHSGSYTDGIFNVGELADIHMTVVNQGTIDANNVEVTLYGSDHYGYNGSSIFIPVGDDYVATIPFIAAGESKSLSAFVTVLYAENGVMRTDAEITKDDGDDIDSTPGDNLTPYDYAFNNNIGENAGGDDQDVALTFADGPSFLHDLALINRQISQGPFTPGDDVTLRVALMVQGGNASGDVVVSYHLPPGLSLSPLDDNSWTSGPPGAVSRSMSLPSNTPFDIAKENIILRIDPAFTGTSLVTNAEILIDPNTDFDSTPGDNSQPNDFVDDNYLFETDGGDDEDPELIEVCQCMVNTNSGSMSLINSSVDCIDEMGSEIVLEATPDGNAIVPDGFELQYVLAIGANKDIIDCSSTPSFMVDDAGWYSIHPVVVNPSQMDLCAYAGCGNILDLVTNMASTNCICGDVNPNGIEIGVSFCCLDYVQMNSDPVPPSLHSAEITLSSSGKVNLGGTTRFTAGECVNFTPEFTVELGSVLEASIAPCAANGN